MAAMPGKRDPARDKFAQRARVRGKRKPKRFRRERERGANFRGLRSKGEEDAKGRAAGGCTEGTETDGVVGWGVRRENRSDAGSVGAADGGEGAWGVAAALDE